ncbi:hypothetical protein NDU88_005017 [Pleurodeles waltl]|uniref:Uncharacterized protein n=1 Tax=Pleurodeles waltl TaxID=8319 RepID=A0AAV7RN36_PLEWA|nr:hypothetical protein NDU88_005017 [Pleurodeles waltl]
MTLGLTTGDENGHCSSPMPHSYCCCTPAAKLSGRAVQRSPCSTVERTSIEVRALAPASMTRPSRSQLPSVPTGRGRTVHAPNASLLTPLSVQGALSITKTGAVQRRSKRCPILASEQERNGTEIKALWSSQQPPASDTAPRIGPFLHWQNPYLPSSILARREGSVRLK